MQFFVYRRSVQRLANPYRIILSVITAALVSLIVPPASYQLSESKMYKTLLRIKPAVYADQSIVLIEVIPETLSPMTVKASWGDLLLVLKEMGAKQALITIPDEILKSSFLPVSGLEREVQLRIDEEFELIKQNIAALFEAILYGSVHPKDTAFYVENLLSLTDESKERLVDSILHTAARDMLLFEKARGLFGAENTGQTPGELGYNLPETDSALTVTDFPRVPPDALPFRRITDELISNYVQVDEKLYSLLLAMEEGGYLGATPPEMYPSFLYEHAHSLLLELLVRPRELKVMEWRDAKERYMQSVDELLSDKTETDLDTSFAALLDEVQDDTQRRYILGQRQRLSDTFSEARELFTEITAARERVSKELHGALCIIGLAPDPLRDTEKAWLEPTAAEQAAAQIHSIRSGHHSVIVTGWKQRAYIAAPGLLFGLLLGLVNLPLVFLIGFFGMLTTAAGFSALYAVTGIFVHPVYAALVPGATAAVMVVIGVSLRLGYAPKIGPAAGTRFSRVSRRVFGAVGTSPSKLRGSSYSVILAVRSRPDVTWSADRTGKQRAAILKEFHHAAAAVIHSHNGAVIGADDTVIFAGFGSHFDNAMHAASELSGRATDRSDTWYCGVSAGECTYYESSINGFSVEGDAVVYARILSGLAVKYGDQVLVSTEIQQHAGNRWAVKKLGSMVEKASGRQKEFFALIDRQSG